MFSMSSVNRRRPVIFFTSSYCVLDFSEWFFVKCVLDIQNGRSRFEQEDGENDLNFVVVAESA
jgi:hypothetical protein